MFKEKISEFIINSKFLISFAALLFTISTPILLGIELQFYYFYILIFFSTLFEYNLHRVNFKDSFNNENITPLILCFLSALIVIITCFYADFLIFILLIPFGLISLFYTIPFYKSKRNSLSNSPMIFRIKDLPYLKIFAISLVWSLVSTLPFLFKNDFLYNKIDFYLILIEKFLFIFAITLPFDIRDSKIDFKDNIKTIPHLMNLQDHSLPILVIIFLTIIQMFHFYIIGKYLILAGLLISNLISIIILTNLKLQKNKHYYYGYVDSTIVIQGFILIIIYIIL